MAPRARTRLSSTAAELAGILRVLPRHTHNLPRRVVEQSQRWRMLDAMAEAVATRGYGAASVADVIEIAGVSRKTFYEQFADKDTCFRTAYEAIADYLLQMMIAAGIAHRPGPARRRAQLVRFLDGLVADPHSARAFLVEALAAGPRALELREKIIAKYERAAFGGTGHPIHRAAIIGGILTVVASEVRAGRIARLPGLVDALAAFMERALARSRPAKTNRARR